MNITLSPNIGRATRRLPIPLGVSRLASSFLVVLAFAMIGFVKATGLQPLVLNAGSKSDFLELEILDHVLGAATYTPPVTVYFGLFTVAPSDTGGGTEVTIGSNAYARVVVTNNPTNFPAAVAGQKKNGTVVTWPAATGSWGTVVAAGIFDAATAGNLLYWATLSINKTVDSGDTVSIPVNSLVITED